MRQNRGRQNVTVSFQVDQNSISQTLTEIERLHQSILRLTGGNGTQPAASRGRFTGTPPMDPGAMSGSAPIGGGGFVGSMGQVGGMMPPYALPQSGSFSQAINLTGVTTVNITASVVNLSGGGAVGTTGGISGGAGGQGAVGGIPPGHPSSRLGGSFGTNFGYHTPTYNLGVMGGDQLQSMNMYRAGFFGQMIPSIMSGPANIFMEQMQQAMMASALPASSLATGATFMQPQITAAQAAAQSLLPAISKAAPYLVPLALMGGGGSAATTVFQEQMGIQYAGARFGLSALGGQLAGSQERVALGIQGEDINRQAWLSGTRSTGVYQVGNFLTGGHFDRLNAEIEQQQRLRGDVAGAKARGRFYGLSIDALPGTNEAAGMSAEDLAQALANFDSPMVATQSSLAKSGLFAASGNKTGRGIAALINRYAARWAEDGMTNVDALESMTRGITGMVGRNNFATLDAMLGTGEIGDTMSYGMMGFLKGDRNPDAVRVLRENIMRKRGMSESQANALLYGAAYNSMSNTYTASTESAYASSSMAQAQYTAARGGSVERVSQLQLRGAAQVSDQADALEQQYQTLAAVAPNDPQSRAELANLRAQIDQLRASAASVEKSAVLAPYQNTINIAGTRQGISSVETSLARYQGVSEYDNAGYASQRRFNQQAAQAIRALKNDPIAWSKLQEAEKWQYEAELRRAELADYEIGRSMIEGRRGEAMSYIGVSEAGRGRATSMAQLYGSPTETASARQEQLKTIDETIQVEKEYLAQLRQNYGSLRERNDVEARITQLETQRAVQEEQILRDRAAQEIQLSRTKESMYSATGATQTLQGGSLAGMSSRSQAVSQQRQTVTQLRQELQRELAKTGGTETPYTTQKRAELAQAEYGVAQGEIGLGEYQTSPEMRTRLARNDVGMAIMTRTYAQYGDVRGAIESRMGMVDEQILELKKTTQRAMSSASPENRSAIEARATEQMRSLMMEKVGLQQQLEQGFTERLISEVYNAPDSFNAVMSGFSKREASKFLTVQPFGGNKEQADYYKSKGRLWYNNFAHAMGTPAGFNEMAMTGMSQDMAKGVQVNLGEGSIVVHVTLEDGSRSQTGQATVTQVNINNKALSQTVRDSKGAMQ